MANINLLPWRDAYRQERKKEFFMVLVLFCLIGAGTGYVWVSLAKSSISNQLQRNHLLKTEIASLDEQVKGIEELKKRREELEVRIRIIRDLQANRPLVVRYFDELVRSVPEGLYLSKLERAGDSFSMSGKTESNSRVSSLMRNLDNSDWFTAPNLRNVIADDFELTVDATASNGEGGEG